MAPISMALMTLACSATAANAGGAASSSSIEWLASWVPTSSKIDLSKVVRADSQGRRTWSTAGVCSISGNRLVTGRATGACTLTLRIGSTSRLASTTSRTLLQVRKRTELNVHVAASMTRVFTDLGAAFTARFMNVSVKFNFGGSATLATQIQQGAPADIVVMADFVNIEKLVTSGDVETKDIVDLARNKLAILVPRGNPNRITSIGDLSRTTLKVVLCDSSQPCGKYADVSLARGNVALKPASREANASAVVARVANGEADAGISYVTDGLIVGDKIDAIRIPDSLNVIAAYPLAIVSRPSSRDSVAAKAFVAMARGPIGDKLLRDAGFELP